MKLAAKVALVTGSSRGIGAGCVKALAKEGAKVVINYCKSEDRALKVLEEIKAFGGKGIIAQGDISNEKDVARIVEKANHTFGKINILVNNANSSSVIKPFLKNTWEDFLSNIQVELKGTFYCCQAVVPGMMEGKWGRIIDIGASTLFHRPELNIYGYWAAKGAKLALGKALAISLGPYGITVNTVAPGITETEVHKIWNFSEMGYKDFEEMKRVKVEEQMIKRIGKPEDIAAAVVFFASDEASFITGAVLHASGGKVLFSV